MTSVAFEKQVSSPKLEHSYLHSHSPRILTLEFLSPLTITYLVSEPYNPEAMLNCFKLSSVRLLGSYVVHHPSSFISYVPTEYDQTE